LALDGSFSGVSDTLLTIVYQAGNEA
jgi:hypothetical protein